MAPTNLDNSTKRAGSLVSPERWLTFCWWSHSRLLLKLHKSESYCQDFYKNLLYFIYLFRVIRNDSHLSDKLLLLGRLRHAADLLVQLSEGSLSVTQALWWLFRVCSHWRRWVNNCSPRPKFRTRTQRQIILKRTRNGGKNIFSSY